MTASSPAAPEQRTETIRRSLSTYNMAEHRRAEAALASLDAELAILRQALEQERRQNATLEAGYGMQNDYLQERLEEAKQALRPFAIDVTERQDVNGYVTWRVPTRWMAAARAVLAGEDTT